MPNILHSFIYKIINSAFFFPFNHSSKCLKLMILDIDNPFGFASWKSGNRRLEIYCHGFGSTVFVAVHFGMCLGNRRHYFQSTFTLRYARTYWCQTFRNSKIWCLEFGCFHWKPNLLWNCFLKPHQKWNLWCQYP